MKLEDAGSTQRSLIEQRRHVREEWSRSGRYGLPDYNPKYEEVALLSSFGTSDLDLRNVEGRAVLNDSVAVERDGEVRYVLDSDVRRRVLQQMGSREHMQSVLGRIGARATDLTQQAINRIVESDEAVTTGDDVTVGWLQAVYRTLKWFDGIIPTEPPEEVLARIEASAFAERFRSLVGDNFRGRESELQMLRKYVGVLSRGRGPVAWITERWSTFEEKPALMITGPGGMGKSTLLAQFVLDHSTLVDKDQIPFVYIDFDSPTVRAGDFKTLLIEGLSQLAIQYPEFDITINSQSASWRAEVLELAEIESPGRRLLRERELDDRFHREFLNLLKSLGIDDRPLLLILDTFEAVQERQSNDISALMEYLRRMQQDHEPLRVVISGRAEPGEHADDSEKGWIPTTVSPLKGLDRHTAEEYLVFEGLPEEHASQIARALVPEEAEEDGASPLSLRVAAAIWHQDDDRPDLGTSFWASLTAGRIQVQLITRYLRHIDPDSPSGKLAPPAMLLRRVTADALRHVVAPAWDIPLTADEAENVLLDMEVRISLVTRRSPEALEPRGDVQRQIRDLLKDLENDRVERLHQLAVAYYSQRSVQNDLTDEERLEARADEILHSLAADLDHEFIRSRWQPELVDLLAGRVGLLDVEQQAVLNDLAGLSLTEEARAAVSLRVWLADAVRRSERALAKGDAAGVLQIAGERDDWDRASELSLMVGRAQLELDRPLDVRDTVRAAFTGGEGGIQSGTVADLHLLAAEAAFDTDQPQDVLDEAEHAVGLAREREDPFQLSRGLLLRLEVEHDRDEHTTIDTLMSLEVSLNHVDGGFSEREMRRLLRLAGAFPTLVPKGIRLGGLQYLDDAERRSLARLIAEIDRDESTASDSDTGAVSRSVGITTGKSVTRTWQDILEHPDANAIDSVLRFIAAEMSDVARTTILTTLSDRLGGASRDPIASKTSTVTQGTVGLTARRRRSLVEALVFAFPLAELDELVSMEFDRSIGSLADLDDATEAVYERIVKAAQEEQWLPHLVIAARNWKPADVGLYRIANELDLTAMHFSQDSLRRTVGETALDKVTAELGVVEGRIGRLEVDGHLIGTSLLVGPDLLLVYGRSLDQSGSDQLQVRFGRKADSKGRVSDAGVAYPVRNSGVIERVPIENSMGYALVRFDGFPGDEPVGSGRGENAYARRGFVDVSVFSEVTEQQTVLICWQQAHRLELLVRRRATSRTGDIYSVPHMSPTAEGAPCFSRTMEFLGLLLGGEGDRTRLLAASDLWESIRDHGHGGTVGLALA